MIYLIFKIYNAKYLRIRVLIVILDVTTSIRRSFFVGLDAYSRDYYLNGAELLSLVTKDRGVEFCLRVNLSPCHTLGGIGSPLFLLKRRPLSRGVLVSENVIDLLFFPFCFFFADVSVLTIEAIVMLRVLVTLDCKGC